MISKYKIIVNILYLALAALDKMEYLLCETHGNFVKYVDSNKNLQCSNCRVSNTEGYTEYRLICTHCNKFPVKYICKSEFYTESDFYTVKYKFMSHFGLYCEECAFDYKEGALHALKCVQCNNTSNIDPDHKCDSDCKSLGCHNNCNQMFVCKKTFNIYCPDCASQSFEADTDVYSIVCYKCENVDPKQFYVYTRYNDSTKWYVLQDKNQRLECIRNIKHSNIYCGKCFEP